MPDIQIKLIGDKKLIQMLKTLPGKVRRKVVQPAFLKAARPIRDLARTRAPKSPGSSGLLRKHIKVRRKKAKEATVKGAIEVRVGTGTREEMQIPSGDSGYYPAIIEFGREGVPPDPYLKSSFVSRESQTKKIIAKEIGAGILKQARKGAL